MLSSAKKGTMITLCPKCKAENQDESKFCNECGTQITGSEKASAHTETLEAPKEELTTGATFAGRYQIIEELGKGGMGKVYKVLDKEVKAKIALKLIKPEIASDKKTIERFRNELKTARDISHKNICRMYDLNKEESSFFITMEYVSGEDLKSLIRRVGRLDSATAIKTAKQVCEGLTEAHRLGVIHRDLKPSNIMIDENGDARIMDFGIARSLKGKSITGSGVLIGTPEYMSPEQVEGKDVDHRSDIYSLGVNLYEMVTGKIPFEGDTPLSIAHKQKYEAPQIPNEINPQIPDDLSRVIMKCLEKDKEKRYQSTEELSSELVNIEKEIPTTDKVVPTKKPITSKEITVTFGLKKILVPALVFVGIIIVGVIVWQLIPKQEATSTLMTKPSIAVLPFEDHSSQKDQEVLCDGMTNEIIVKLTRLQDWKVINRNTMGQYKNTTKDIKEIGEELDVETVLLGTVQKEGDDIRVTGQLVNVVDRSNIWSNTYSQKLETVFEIQSDIAGNIVRALQVKLTPEEGQKIKKKPTENVEAYQFYSQGRWLWDKRDKESLFEAIKYFEKAIEIDPNYARAYVGLADVYIVLPWYVTISPLEAYSKAKDYIFKALDIDETIAEAYASLGGIKEQIDFDWEEAEANYKKCIELNPSYATGHFWYSLHLSARGRHDEAIAEINLALELDPLSLIINSNVGQAYYRARLYEQAILQHQKTLELYPKSAAVINEYARTLLEVGRLDEAVTEYQKAVELSEELPEYLSKLAHTYAVMGKRSEAENIIHSLIERAGREYVSPYWLGATYVALGEKDLALECLEKAYEERDVAIIFLKILPIWDEIRNEPRYKALLKKINLE
jgi:serine/threonine protein kinase/tetratricopeptide (TPR) repeat protein